VRRFIGKLRDELGTPLIYDRRARGWHSDCTPGEHPFELPGLWLNASELYALLATHQLLSRVEPGLITEDIAPLVERMKSILRTKRIGSGASCESGNFSISQGTALAAAAARSRMRWRCRACGRSSSSWRIRRDSVCQAHCGCRR
jgi:hypothetical protein